MNQLITASVAADGSELLMNSMADKFKKVHMGVLKSSDISFGYKRNFGIRDILKVKALVQSTILEVDDEIKGMLTC